MGCLSSTQHPQDPGPRGLQGADLHTGNWPHEGVDFTGKTVGVIGTAPRQSSRSRSWPNRPSISPVFQRTANYTVPAHNKPLDPAYASEIKASYPEMRKRAEDQAARRYRFHDQPRFGGRDDPEAERNREFQARWDYGGLGFMASFSDLLLNDDSNKLAADFVRAKVHQVVSDPKTAEALVPRNIIGCKRLCVDTGYWATFNRPNVTLVRHQRRAHRTRHRHWPAAKGQDYAFDYLVLATGFDAMTGALLKVDFRGRDGVTLKEKWNEGPKTYLGLTVVGFPNLFMITGPGSPSVLTNMLPSIEQHVDFIADCLEAVRAKGQDRDRARAAGAGSLGRPCRRGCRTSRCARPAVPRWHVAPTSPASREPLHAIHRWSAGLHPGLRDGGEERLRRICVGVERLRYDAWIGRESLSASLFPDLGRGCTLPNSQLRPGAAANRDLV